VSWSLLAHLEILALGSLGIGFPMRTKPPPQPSGSIADEGTHACSPVAQIVLKSDMVEKRVPAEPPESDTDFGRMQAKARLV